MYSVVLMAALTTGGNVADLGHHNACCGEAARCGRHHHHRGNCCGESYCSTCGAPGCATCTASSCPTCSNGVYMVAQADTGKATIVVSLPTDAKLTIDDAATSSTSDQRVFVTPDLPAGQEFHYTLKAEVTVNGKPEVVSQVIAVRAGEETKVTLSAPTGVAAR